MYFLSDTAILFSSKLKEDKKSDKNSLGKKAKGVALLGSSTLVAKQSLDSGIPRLLGVRLEQHGTSKKAAKNIIKEGFLNPAYGGSEGGVTASMKLPKEFLDRSAGHTFISGKNSSHPFWSDRNPLSSISDVVTRKIQVLGYRGSKAGKLTDKDVEQGGKFIGATIGKLTNPLKQKIKEANPDTFLESTRLSALKGDVVAQYQYKYLLENPKELKSTFKREIKDTKNLLRTIEDLKERGYKEESRVRGIRKTQKKFNTLFKNYHDEYKKYLKTDNLPIVRDYKTQKILKGDTNKFTFDNFLENKINNGDNNAKRLLSIKNELKNQLESQKAAKTLGLGAGWTQKLLKSPFLGAAGVGKTLYVPGTDEYFNNTNRFKYDQDDPFGNPLKLKKAMESEASGLGGNALKTTEKVRAFGNKFEASKWLLKKEGDGNILKGISKLIQANPSRSLAGAAVLGAGGTAAYLLGKAGINSVLPQKEKIKVKASSRNGKLIKAYIKKNPFYGKRKLKKNK